jgi:signal transduction histidine kinase
VKLSLRLRIFLYHLVFFVALGALTALMIRTSFERYAREWESEVRTLPPEQLFTPLASEVARSLLLEVEGGTPEQGERYRSGIGEGLDAVLPTVDSIESLAVVDREGRAQYVSAAASRTMRLDDPEMQPRLIAASPSRREVTLPSGERLTEVVLPVHDENEASLGAVVLRMRPVGSPAGTPEEGDAGPPAETAEERLLGPLVTEISRSLLLEIQRGEVVARGELDDYRFRVSDGLGKVLRSVRSIDSLVIVDRYRRIQYVNTPRDLDLTFTDDEQAKLLGTDRPVRRAIELPSGERGTELVIPVFRDPRAGARSDRLGSILVRYRPDPELAARIPKLLPPRVPTSAYTQPLLLFLGAAVVGGVLLAALSGAPVKRLERALADFRARNFKGGIDLKDAGLERDLGSAVQAINELGGRLQAVDERDHEREALLATLSQSLEEGMVVLDPDGTPVAWNPAAARLLLASDGEPASQAEAVRAALLDNDAISLALRRSAPAETVEVDVVAADGTAIPTRVTLVSFEMRPGQIGRLLLLRDLATLRKVEAHLLEAGRFAVLAHLAAGLAHEIRNPLHSIRINATAAEQYVDVAAADRDAKEVAESLHTIKSETSRLTDLLNNYLGMVRPEKEVVTIDLRDLTRRVIQLVGYTARQSRIDIRLEGDEPLPAVRGIPDRLQQAILNLVLNAIQAMPDGGSLSLRTDASEGVVRLTVSDTGPGLPQELADQLFDTRVTTKPGGTGLGLPLVRMIVEAHGGSVWYRSVADRGASFTVVLPTDR